MSSWSSTISSGARRRRLSWPPSRARADGSDRGAVEAMFRAIDERLGRLDMLVNNAGIASRIDSITAITDESWHRTLAVNLDGAFFCLRAAIPRLRAAGRGRVGENSPAR